MSVLKVAYERLSKVNPSDSQAYGQRTGFRSSIVTSGFAGEARPRGGLNQPPRR